MDIELPKYLYKYRKWDKENDNGYDHRFLSNNELFFSSARRFNDPFDCRIPPNYELCSDEQLKSRMRIRLKEDNPDLSDKEIDREVEFWFEKKLWSDPENLKQFEENKFNNFGLLSLAEIEDDILMWSHYANSHKGFCVGIDTERFDEFLRILFSTCKILIDVMKIEYRDVYPLFDPLGINDEEYFKSQFKYKSVHWSYEKEYRYLIFNRKDFPLQVDKGIIKKVILGCEMPEDHKNEIKKIVKEMNSKVTLYQAVKKKEEFGLDIKEIEY